MQLWHCSRATWRVRRRRSRVRTHAAVGALLLAVTAVFIALSAWDDGARHAARRGIWISVLLGAPPPPPPPPLPTSRDPPSLPCVHLHTHSGLLGTVRIVRASFRYLARSSSLFQFVQAFLGIVQIDPKQALHVEKVDDNEAKPILIAKQLNELLSVDVTRLHWCDTGVLTIEVAAQPS